MALLIDRLENALLACLCQLLVDEGRPVCACHFYHGDSRPPADRCGTEGVKNGMAWLRNAGDTWRGASGNASLTWGGGFCGGENAWDISIELGVRRCIQAVQQGDTAPDPDLYNRDRELLKADWHTLHRVLCCDVWTDGEGPGFTITGASVEPLGPGGRCSGNVLTIVVSGDPMAQDPVEPLGFASGPAGGG